MMRKDGNFSKTQPNAGHPSLAESGVAGVRPPPGWLPSAEEDPHCAAAAGHGWVVPQPGCLHGAQVPPPAVLPRTNQRFVTGAGETFLGRAPPPPTTSSHFQASAPPRGGHTQASEGPPQAQAQAQAQPYTSRLVVKNHKPDAPNEQKQLIEALQRYVILKMNQVLSLVTVRQYGVGGGIGGGYGYAGHAGLDVGGLYDHEMQAVRMDISGEIARAFQEATVSQNDHIFRTEGLMIESCRRVAVLEKIIEDKNANTTGATRAAGATGATRATRASRATRATTGTTPGASARPARPSVNDAEVQTDGDASALLAISTPKMQSNSGSTGKNASLATADVADSTANAAAASCGLVLLKAPDSGEELVALSRATMISHLKIVRGSQKRVADMAEKLAEARMATEAAEFKSLAMMLEFQAIEDVKRETDADAARKKQAIEADAVRKKQAADDDAARQKQEADADAARKKQEQAESDALLEKLAKQFVVNVNRQGAKDEAAARKKQEEDAVARQRQAAEEADAAARKKQTAEVNAAARKNGANGATSKRSAGGSGVAGGGGEGRGGWGGLDVVQEGEEEEEEEEEAEEEEEEEERQRQGLRRGGSDSATAAATAAEDTGSRNVNSRFQDGWTATATEKPHPKKILRREQKKQEEAVAEVAGLDGGSASGTHRGSRRSTSTTKTATAVASSRIRGGGGGGGGWGGGGGRGGSGGDDGGWSGGGSGRGGGGGGGGNSSRTGAPKKNKPRRSSRKHAHLDAPHDLHLDHLVEDPASPAKSVGAKSKYVVRKYLAADDGGGGDKETAPLAENASGRGGW